MANTYIKIYLHIVFAVKNRAAMLLPTCRDKVHAYMTSALRGMGHVPIIVGGVSDHVHILMSYTPTQPLADMIRDLKINTTKFINGQRLVSSHFAWQSGYGCFSYSPTHVEQVRNYILNQENHHRKVNMRDEMKNIFAKFGIEYQEQYIFNDPE